MADLSVDFSNQMMGWFVVQGCLDLHVVGHSPIIIVMAISVIKDCDLFLLIVKYQYGLPLRVRRVLALAEQVIIKPCFNTAPYFPSAYLSNFPPPYADLEYIKRVSSPSGSIFNYSLFLSGNYAAPALPLHLAIVEGILDHVQHLAAWEPAWVSHESVSLAAMCGRLQILQHLAKLPGGAPTADAMNLAAMTGYLDVVEWMHGLPDGPGCMAQAIDGAAAHGHVNVVAFLHEHRSGGCTAESFKKAICSGHAAVVDYVLSKRVPILAEPTVHSAKVRYYRQAPDSDHFRTLRVLKAHGALTHLDWMVVHYAVLSHDGREALQFLCAWDAWRIDSQALNSVIKTKDRKCIEYALRRLLQDNDRWPVESLGEDGCLWDLKEELPWARWTPRDSTNCLWRTYSISMDVAACLGDLPTVELLHRLSLDCCSEKALVYACARGHLDVAKWLYANRSRNYTLDAMVLAAVGGHLPIVKWLHTACRVPSSEDALVAAADRGDIVMLMYLVSLPTTVDPSQGGLGTTRHACTPDEITYYQKGGLAVDVAAARGHLSVIQLLSRRRPILSTTSGMLRSFITRGSRTSSPLCSLPRRASTAAMNLAAANGHQEIVQYLHEHRKEGCTAEAFHGAISGGHDGILEFLATHYTSVVTDRGHLYEAAARRGNVATMKTLWLLLPIKLTPELGARMVETTATYGHLDLMKWLIETKGLRYTQNALEYAQSYGHKRVVKYLTESR
ncbi:hypothetical protein ACHHYP_06479 [Achlya hypogyna]|uniref:Uncharacterized protein n=1 Tax=Achlya hypogyna TaxID=1202772 RepID=A0A1V9YTI7_ACHHY|nr:hypothetical protein ACHHYP_06479 [Achlya hypogyna]